MALTPQAQRKVPMRHWVPAGNNPLFSPENILKMVPHCLRLLAQLARLAASLARDSAGSRMAARIPMMAMTTSNSISVNPDRLRDISLLLHENVGSWILQDHTAAITEMCALIDLSTQERLTANEVCRITSFHLRPARSVALY